MGYQVYEKNNRFQGYGVPAYCDVKGCYKTIDRGLGYLHSEEDQSDPNIFCCEDHKYEPLSTLELEDKELKECIYHIEKDESWEKWRNENPKDFARLKSLVKEKS